MKQKIENFLLQVFTPQGAKVQIVMVVILGALAIAYTVFHAQLGIVEKPF